ncbi:hypothetical protein [Haloferula sp. A504]|uniref:hypothetical protein n=1 Tax=Haloferula sp. A504 TaxID=3373601 RepID=UPI0031C56BF6|nr:hypothetical protein [Verrucomicrobiaceae bacterium E54]
MSRPLHTFPSDAERERTPNLGEVLPPDPEPHNLLSHTVPHYAGGFRIVAECSGFRILERWNPGGKREVERSDQIEAAYWRDLCGGNSGESSTSPERRAALALALDRLMAFAENEREALEPLRDRLTISAHDIDKVGEGLGGHVRLGATFGLELAEALNSPDIEDAIGDLTKSFRVALDNLARARGKKKEDGRRKSGRPCVINAILEAQRQFVFSTDSERRLSRASIRARMEACGFSYPKKHRKRDWEDLFKRAALGDLPD